MTKRDASRQGSVEADPMFAKVSLAEVSVGYEPGRPVLHHVDLSIEPGEILSLLGPSGCGKSTLLRAIAGLQPLSSGSIEIGGVTVDGPGVHYEPHRRRVGMVFQDGALFPHLTVSENIEFGLRGVDDASSRVAELLKIVELEGFADRRPDTLSGGQRQRVALARALAPRPSVLLLDEPFSALDPGMRVQLRRDVRRILSQVGITAIVVTHDQDEAFVLGDRVAVMRDGRVRQIGPSTELYDRPDDRWVAEFVGEANLITGVLQGDAEVSTAFGLHAVHAPQPGFEAEGQVDVLIRPEHLVVVPGGPATHEGSDRPTVRVHVESAEYFGHDVLYEVTGADQLFSVRSTDTSLSPGDAAFVRYVGPPVQIWRRSTTEG